MGILLLVVDILALLSAWEQREEAKRCHSDGLKSRKNLLRLFPQVTYRKASKEGDPS
jgi:hypothetical protein